MIDCVMDTPRARTLLEVWERQQEVYVYEREARFDAVADAVSMAGTASPAILDLGCGPGSLGSHLLARWPGGRAVGVDRDPVLLEVGRAAHAGDGRRTWLDLDLSSPGWDRGILAGGFDAVVSATALHWLDPDAVAAVYAASRRLLRPGGVLVNADLMDFADDQPTLRELARSRQDELRWEKKRSGVPSWGGWWRPVEAQPDLADLVAERQRRFPEPRKRLMPLGWHLDALGRAGYRERGSIWQRLNHHIVVALA